MKKNIKYILSLCIAVSIFAQNVYATEQIDIEATEINENENTLTEEDLKIYNIVKNAPVYTPTTFIATTSESFQDELDITIKTKQTIFESGDVYSINRIYFKETKDETYNVSIPIDGNTITVRYIDPETKEWVNTSNMENLKHTTLFIDTDKASYVVSVPAVYSNIYTNNTLTIARDKEEMVKIVKNDGYFDLQMSFPKDENYIAEYWYMQSEKSLVDWSLSTSFDELLPHDLSETRRWSYDGYYFQTPSNYNPGGTDILYRHPSNYTGASFARYGKNTLSKNLGYLMTETCMQNQNNLGYWETGPQSEWLFTDFQIGAGFYDTRFNTDFATSLLYAYQNYSNKEFLTAAVTYAEYFLKFAEENNYPTENGGILVEDYGYTEEHEKTHVSLNHQVSEMNFLYEIYNITKEESYLDMANKMLKGIEDTQDKWILEDGNLVYALYYTKDTNKMEDYPYLTYNDLYQTRTLLKKLFNTTNDTVELLMASKKQWMDANGVTDYTK